MSTTYKIIGEFNRRIQYQAISSTKLSEEDLGVLQDKLGYNVLGYGLFSISESVDSGIYTYNWLSSNTCD